MKSQLLTTPGKEPTTPFFSSNSSGGTTRDRSNLFNMKSALVFPACTQVRRISSSTFLFDSIKQLTWIAGATRRARRARRLPHAIWGFKLVADG